MTTYRTERHDAADAAHDWSVISTDDHMVQRLMITHLTKSVAQSIVDHLRQFGTTRQSDKRLT
jgi:hypothetical protein